jgi:hypothetical protein
MFVGKKTVTSRRSSFDRIAAFMVPLISMNLALAGSVDKVRLKRRNDE